MNHGSMAMGMIGKQRSSHSKGYCLVLHAWRRHGKATARSRSCYLYFWIGKMLSIMNIPLQAKQLIRSITSMFIIGWEMWCSENGHNYGQLVTGSFIMTMGLLTHQVLWRVFLQNIKSPRWLKPPYSPDLAPCNFWLFPKLKSLLKGKKFQTIDEIQENTMGQLMVIGISVWGPKVPTLKGTEVSLSYIQCFLYLVSSSINVSFPYYIDEYLLDRPHCSERGLLRTLAVYSWSSVGSIRWGWQQGPDVLVSILMGSGIGLGLGPPSI